MTIPPDFVCEYADRPGEKCGPCDCFVDIYPDDPFGLHPEAFVVGGRDHFTHTEAQAAAYEAAHNETTRLQEALDNGYEPEDGR